MGCATIDAGLKRIAPPRPTPPLLLLLAATLATAAACQDKGSLVVLSMTFDSETSASIKRITVDLNTQPVDEITDIPSAGTLKLGYFIGRHESKVAVLVQTFDTLDRPATPLEIGRAHV